VSEWLRKTRVSVIYFYRPRPSKNIFLNLRFQSIYHRDSVPTCCSSRHRGNTQSKYIRSPQYTHSMSPVRIRRVCPRLQPTVDSVPKRIIQRIIWGTQSRTMSPWRSLRQSRSKAASKTFNFTLKKILVLMWNVCEEYSTAADKII